jgi:predicted transcriptional regulator YdeE
MKNFTENIKVQKYENVKKIGKTYFMFEDVVSNEKIQGRVSRIHKTIAPNYKYKHKHTLYSRLSINPLALTMHI